MLKVKYEILEKDENDIGYSWARKITTCPKCNGAGYKTYSNGYECDCRYCSGKGHFVNVVKIKDSNSEYVGNINDKISISVVVVKETIFYSYLKHTHNNIKKRAYTFKDSNDNVFVWYTSTYHKELKENATINITARIKNHKMYNNEKQTLLTYCKIS